VKKHHTYLRLVKKQAKEDKEKAYVKVKEKRCRRVSKKNLSLPWSWGTKERRLYVSGKVHFGVRGIPWVHESTGIERVTKKEK